MTWHLVVNPTSGSSPDRAVLEALDFGDRDVRIRETARAGHARDLAAEAVRDGASGVIACGGDGTLSEIVDGLLGAGGGIPLAVLPCGTGNDLARTLDLPLDPAGAAAVVRTGAPVALDAIRVRLADGTERCGLNAVVGGSPVAVTGALDQQTKRTFGALVFAATGAKLLADPRTWDLRVAIDGLPPEVFTGIGVVVSNGRTCGGGLQCAPLADPADGMLEVSLVRAADPLAYTRLAARLLGGTAHEDPLVLQHPARRVTVEAGVPMPFNLDGEVIGDTPVTVEVVPGAVQVILPA